MKKERLIETAIDRGGSIHHAFRSHYQLRQSLSPGRVSNETKPGDLDGFWTSAGRFVDRNEARNIAIEAGQINESWRFSKRLLLSSDVNW